MTEAILLSDGGFDYARLTMSASVMKRHLIQIFG
jgi:hypothetical protein